MDNWVITLTPYRGMPIAILPSPRRVAIVYWNPKGRISCADHRTGGLLRLRRRRFLLRIRRPASLRHTAPRQGIELGSSDFLCRYDGHEPGYRPGPVRNLCERVGFVYRCGYPDGGRQRGRPVNREPCHFLRPRQSQSSFDRRTSILRFPSRGRPYGTEVRFLPPGFLLLLIAPFPPIA